LILAVINSNKIVFGATIKLYDENANLEITYKIVGVDETNVEKGLISLALQLLGH
jgi:transcription elongation factor GreA